VRGWIKLDDAMPEHPKITVLTAQAFRAYVSSIAYANRNLTDGFVPARVAFGLCDDADRAEPLQVEQELVDAALWEPKADGYVVHDYLAYQRSKADILELARVRSEAGRKGGQANASKPSVQAESKQVLKQNASKSQAELELKDQKPRARARGKSSEPRPNAGAYQQHAPSQTAPIDANAGLELARRLAGKPSA
jgi:hypothetical protein